MIPINLTKLYGVLFSIFVVSYYIVIFVMFSIGIISLLVAIPVFSYRITPSLFNRITSVVLIYSALLAFNGLHIESLAFGVGIYSGLFITITVYSFFIVLVVTLVNIDKCKSFIQPGIIRVATYIYYHFITILMSRYTLFFFGILLSIVMSICTSSPVYCQDEPTQAIAATAVESKASISGSAADINQKSDASTTSPIFNSPTPMKAQDIIANYGPAVSIIVTGGIVLGNVYLDKHFPTGIQLKTVFGSAIANAGLRAGAAVAGTATVSVLTAGTFHGVLLYSEYYNNRIAQFGANSNPNLTISREQAEAIKFSNQSSDAGIAKHVDTTEDLETNLLEQNFLQSKYRAVAEINQNTLANRDIVNRPDLIPCILEEGDTNSFSFVQSINDFVLNWVNSNYGTRVPANLSGNLLDYFTFDFSFTSLNLSIIFMHTVVYWFLFFIFTKLSLNYFSTKLISWLNKAKINTAVMQVFNFITMLVVVFLFIVILIFSVYIYFYCNIPEGVAYHINNTMKSIQDKTTDITIANTFLGVDSGNYMKLSGSVALCILGIYRTYIVIRPLNLSTTITSCFIMFVIYTVKITYTFITKITTISTDCKPVTLLELFARYNDCNHVLFYSMIIIIISVVIVTIISHQCYAENNKIGKSNKYLFYKVLLAYLKIITSIAVYCAFQSIVFLNVYSIPGYIDDYLTLYLFLVI